MKLRVVLGPGEDHLGEHRLVELDQRPRRRPAGRATSSRSTRTMSSARCSRERYDPVGDALEPHRPGQQIRARAARPSPAGRSARARTRARAPASGRLRPSGPKTAGCRTSDGRARRGPAARRETSRGRRRSGSRSVSGMSWQLSSRAADEARVVVAPLLAVGDDVDAGAQLRVDGQPDGVVGGRLRTPPRRSRPSRCSCMACSIQRGRGQLPMPMTASGRIGGRRRRRRQRRGDGHRHDRPREHRGRRRRARRRGRGARPLSGPLQTRKLRCAPGLRERDQLVAGQPAPGREVLLDRDLGRADLQQLAAAPAGRGAGGSGAGARCRSRGRRRRS